MANGNPEQQQQIYELCLRQTDANLWSFSSQVKCIAMYTNDKNIQNYTAYVQNTLDKVDAAHKMVLFESAVFLFHQYPKVVSGLIFRLLSNEYYDYFLLSKYYQALTLKLSDIQISHLWSLALKMSKTTEFKASELMDVHCDMAMNAISADPSNINAWKLLFRITEHMLKIEIDQSRMDFKMAKSFADVIFMNLDAEGQQQTSLLLTYLCFNRKARISHSVLSVANEVLSTMYLKPDKSKMTIALNVLVMTQYGVDFLSKVLQFKRIPEIEQKLGIYFVRMNNFLPLDLWGLFHFMPYNEGVFKRYLVSQEPAKMVSLLIKHRLFAQVPLFLKGLPQSSLVRAINGYINFEMSLKAFFGSESPRAASPSSSVSSSAGFQKFDNSLHISNCTRLLLQLSQVKAEASKVMKPGCIVVCRLIKYREVLEKFKRLFVLWEGLSKIRFNKQPNMLAKLFIEKKDATCLLSAYLNFQCMIASYSIFNPQKKHQQPPRELSRSVLREEVNQLMQKLPLIVKNPMDGGKLLQEDAFQAARTILS